MERYILDDFAFNLQFEQVKDKLKVTEQEDVAFVESLFVKAKEIAKPKALYKVCYVDSRNGNEVIIDGVCFKSLVMSEKLGDIHRVFAYVATCGAELDQWSRGEDDFVAAIWMDTIKEMILYDAFKQFKDILKGRYKIFKMSTMSPGSGNADTWPIQQQTELFGLLGDVYGDIGVKLTSTMLMVPNKSVSGIAFPSEKEFVTCSLCKRESCPNRHAPYDGECS